SAVLKESGQFYTKCKHVTPDITRIANDPRLPLRSASYRDRIVPTAQDGGEVDMRAGERLNAILARAKEAEGKMGRSKKHTVMIPQRELGTYTVAPRVGAGVGRGSVSVDVDIERRRKNAERLRTLMRKGVFGHMIIQEPSHRDCDIVLFVRV
ncbi:hypothetical protein B0H34DRAFT_729741, partial [Crassisporium funariophilum]